MSFQGNNTPAQSGACEATDPVLATPSHADTTTDSVAETVTVGPNEANVDAPAMQVASAIAQEAIAASPDGAGRDLASDQALQELFKDSDAVDDSVLDGYYSIRDMDAFEKWISQSILSKPALVAPDDSLKQKTLVLDLDNTLIARDAYPSDFGVDCENGCFYSIQLHPMCLTFLHEMRHHYRRIAIYTSSSKIYASKIVHQIEGRYHKAYPDHCCLIFHSVLSCNDCVADNRERRKDLLRFGNLNHVVFVDDDPYYSFKNQNDNVIQVRRYHGKAEEEGGLMALVPLLKFLSSVDSVSTTIRKLKKVWHNLGLVEVVQSTYGITC